MASPHSQRRGFRWWIFQLAVFLSAIIVALICLETGFRLARRGEIGFDRLGWDADTQSGKSGRIYEKTPEFEFSTTINQLGFRGSEISESKPSDSKRVLILGDSFVFGWGVNDDQIFTTHLARELQKSPQRYQIINTAGGSLSPLVYYVRVKNRYLRLKPDVVLMFLNYADVREDYLFKRNIIRDSHGDIADLNPLYTNGKLDTWKWLRSKSEFLSFTYNKFNRTLRRIQILGFWRYIEATLKGERIRDAMFDEDNTAGRAMEAIEYDGYFMLRDYTRAELIRKYLSETTDYIARTQELLKQQGASLTLILLPNGVQVGPEQWSKGRQRWGFDEGRIYENPLMVNELKSFAKKIGVGFVNLTDAFKKNNSQQLFYDRDGHFTSAGHAVLANGLLAAPEIRTVLALP